MFSPQDSQLEIARDNDAIAAGKVFNETATLADSLTGVLAADVRPPPLGSGPRASRPRPGGWLSPRRPLAIPAAPQFPAAQAHSWGTGRGGTPAHRACPPGRHLQVSGLSGSCPATGSAPCPPGVPSCCCAAVKPEIAGPLSQRLLPW